MDVGNNILVALGAAHIVSVSPTHALRDNPLTVSPEVLDFAKGTFWGVFALSMCANPISLKLSTIRYLTTCSFLDALGS